MKTPEFYKECPPSQVEALVWIPPGTNKRTDFGDPAKRNEHAAAARAKYKNTREEWATLQLRQTFKDEALMRAHIKAAGLIAPTAAEPATVRRLRTLLHRANIVEPEIKESLGFSKSGYIGLSGYLKRNPNLPLWAALALVIEATGRFTPEN